MSADATEVAALAAALADPTRMRICLALVDGRARTCGELARLAGVAPSTTSEHLSRLVGAGLLVEERQGRHRYVRLADDQVAQLLEDLSSRRLAPAPRVSSLRGRRVALDLAFARTCYDHLAGRLGVATFDALVARGLLDDAAGVAVTEQGRSWLLALGGGRLAERSTRRPLARPCLDWTERRPHLAGTSGAALLDALVAHGWVERRTGERSLLVTTSGTKWFRAELSLETAALRAAAA